MRQRISNKSVRCSYKPKIGALMFLCFLGLCFIYLPSQLYAAYTETKLTASDGAANDYFGYSVAVSGDTVVVGASSDDDNGTDSGSAYVYRYDGSMWQETKLTASDGEPNDLFGNSVAISEDTAMVGSPLDDDVGSMSGSAYVFVRSGTSWSQ